ncbi:cytochrome P450 [Aspergillus ellipticus CBS 707.79]|uniref:Cytochrome P450 n=1 Tax=Aspergillus ellipticus CBS 707.79 TaxID=1448320 RepID=A0A319F1D8_9EURO|nr:cytochrome P450 [Aspergillus ellipticus CBS 707.79]
MEIFLAQGTVWPVVGCLLALSLATIVYRSVRNPLAHLPGPQLSKWSSLVERYYWFSGRKVEYVDYLHRVYGPIVRVTPTEVDVCDLAAVREIHRVRGGYLKSDWYKSLTPPGVTTLLTLTEPAEYSDWRRLLAGPLSDTSLGKVEPMVATHVQATIDLIAEDFQSQGVSDLYQWWTYMATDVVSELSFGEPLGLLTRPKETAWVMDYLDKVGVMHAWRTTFPIVFTLVRIMPLHPFRHALQAIGLLGQWARQSIQQYQSHLDEQPDNPKPTLFTKLFRTGRFNAFQLTSLAGSYITAGSHTTAVTLLYLIYAVCQDDGIRQKLLAEVRALPEDFRHDTVRHLPYLNQVITETLRKYAVVSSALPRVVPAAGATLAGHYLPGGTTVSTQAYTLHRDEAVFPDPEKFDPSRWESPTPEMKDAYMPFGGASRLCIGNSLALMEIRLATARFLRRFPDVHLSRRDGMRDEDLAQEQYLIMAPRGHRLLVEA